MKMNRPGFRRIPRQLLEPKPVHTSPPIFHLFGTIRDRCTDTTNAPDLSSPLAIVKMNPSTRPVTKLRLLPLVHLSHSDFRFPFLVGAPHREVNRIRRRIFPTNPETQTRPKRHLRIAHSYKFPILDCWAVQDLGMQHRKVYYEEWKTIEVRAQ